MGGLTCLHITAEELRSLFTNARMFPGICGLATSEHFDWTLLTRDRQTCLLGEVRRRAKDTVVQRRAPRSGDQLGATPSGLLQRSVQKAAGWRS